MSSQSCSFCALARARLEIAAGPGREAPATGSDAESLALAVSGTLVDLQLERGLLTAQAAAERARPGPQSQ